MPAGQYDAYADFIRPAAAIADIVQGRQRLEIQRQSALTEQERLRNLVEQQRIENLLARDKFGLEQQKTRAVVAADEAQRALNEQKLKEAQETQSQYNIFGQQYGDTFNSIYKDLIDATPTPELTPEKLHDFEEQASDSALTVASRFLPPSKIPEVQQAIQNRGVRRMLGLQAAENRAVAEQNKLKIAQIGADVKDYATETRYAYQQEVLKLKREQEEDRLDALQKKLPDKEKAFLKGRIDAINDDKFSTPAEKAEALRQLRREWEKGDELPIPAAQGDQPTDPSGAMEALTQLDEMEKGGEFFAKRWRDQDTGEIRVGSGRALGYIFGRAAPGATTKSIATIRKEIEEQTGIKARLPQVTTKEEVEKLPPGAKYIYEDPVTKRRQIYTRHK